MSGLLEEVTALRDLFQRRLLEDREKARLYDALYSQVDFAREGLANAYLRPLYGELLLILDRLEQLEPSLVLSSIADELEEVLRRRDVRPAVDVALFDPTLHEAVRTEASDTEPKGGVIRVVRRGYSMGTDVLRPALVVVSSGSELASDEHSATSDEAPSHTAVDHE